MRSDRETQLASLLAGLGIGAALMYLFDPARGRRRRAVARDKTASALDAAQRELRERAVDVGNRARGAAAEMRHAGDDHPADETLVARVRAELGHHVEHARAIEVVAEHGTVILRGPVLRDELDAALTTTRGVRGVEQVRNELEVHDTPDGISSLQGGG